MRFFVTLIVSVFFLSTPLHAEIPGQQAPEFQTAMTRWLAGDDLEALTGFSKLAQADNRAAQLWLGVISTEVWAHAHVTADLQRKDRNALLKAPGGLSGKSWLSVAAQDVPIAKHILETVQPYQAPAPALALLDEGELYLAAPEISDARNAGRYRDAIQIASHPAALNLFEGQLVKLNVEFAMLQHQPSDAELQKMIDDAPPVAPVQRAIWPINRKDPLWRDPDQNSEQLVSDGGLLAQHSLFRPMANAMEAVCGQDMLQELGVLQDFFKNTPLALFVLSPVETLLPTDQYVQSERFTKDIYRRVAAYVNSPQMIERAFPCLAELSPA